MEINIILTKEALEREFPDYKDAKYICESLKQIVIPASIKKIRTSTFACCTSLSKVIIPEGIVEIETYAFWDVRN